MMQNAKCYGCAFFKECKKNEEYMNRCIEHGYILYCTQADKDLCDMMCGEPEDD